MAFALPIISDIFGYINNRDTNATNSNIAAQTNLANYTMQKEANEANERIANNTNAMNQAINEANIALQREQNAINREREDNAVRRRVNDLVGAGLSKTLAAGSAASANAMQAPQATLGMQTGNAMRAASFNAARMNPYRFDNLASVGRMIQEERLKDKELEVQNRALDIEEQQLDETHRHNEATESNQARSIDVDVRYQDLQDKWKSAELDQNSSFHSDAVRLEEASQSIARLNSWSQRNLNAIHELWYQADIDMMKHTDEREAAYLTASLAESSAKIASWYADKKLSEVQAAYLRKQIPLVAEHIVSQIKNIDADTRATLMDAAIKSWNMSVAITENTTTTSSVPGKTEVEQLKKNRIAGYVNNGISTGLKIGAGIFLGSGGGKFLFKVFGFDSHGPMGFVR